MKFKSLGIQNNIVTSYDKTKTFVAGDVQQRVVNSQNVIASPLTTITDVFTDSGGTLTPAANALYTSPNGRHLVASVAAGVITIALYNYNLTTKTRGALVGRIQANTPNTAATTHTIHSLAIYNDAGTTGWKIIFGTTGTVLINGGVFCINSVNLADFTPTPTVFGLAISNNAKAVYQYQDSTQMGALQSATGISVQNGGDIDFTNSIFYCQAGLLANAQMFGFDLTATPNISQLHANVNTVASTSYGGTAPAAYFKTSDATTALSANDPVVITAGAPTAFTASTTTTQTVYFARDIQTVGGLVYFNLSATSGGAAVVPTSTVSTMNLLRANGQSSSAYLASKKSGIGIAGMSGVLVTTNSQQVVTASDGVNAGSLCYFLATTTNVYLFKLSDISAGVTTFPSMDGRNILGSGSGQVTAPILVNAIYMAGINSDGTGVIVYMTNTSSFVMKQWVNNAIVYTFGGLDNVWLEQSTATNVGFGLSAVAAITERNGLLFISGSTAGQRVILTIDISSDALFGTSYFISPVFSTPAQVLKFIQTYEQYFDYTNSLAFQIRTAATSTDAMFNSATGSWGSILPNNMDESSVAVNNFTQIKVSFYVATLFATSPAQVSELLWGYDAKYDNSDYWAGVNDFTTQGATSPSDSVFRLMTQYTTSVPQLFQRDIDVSTFNQISILDSVSNTSSFAYSSDNGLTWNSLGTIPNVVGTLVRVRRTLPGGTNAFTSLKES